MKGITNPAPANLADQPAISTRLADSFARISNNRAILALVGAAVPLLLYLPVSHFGSVNYDDDGYLGYRSRMGLSWNNVKWAFGTFDFANWHPVTWLGHMLDCQLFGPNYGGHHMTNLLLHCLNSALLFLVLASFTQKNIRSFVVAVLFAIHPLNVQSVAWISEKKNLLSTLFLFLAIAAYGRYVRRPGLWRYLLVLILFALGLMSKPMIITFPFLLLLLDYWPLRRLSLWKGKSVAPARSDVESQVEFQAIAPTSTVKLLWEKVPFLVLSAADAVATVVAQKALGAITDAEFRLPIRLENAAVAYVSYISKMFWPVRLAVFYPHPGNSIPPWKALLASIFLLAVTVMVIRGRDRRYLLTGWFAYLGILVPVIGLVQVGSQSMADRYAYLPLIGLFIMLVWGAGDLLGCFSGSSMAKIAGVVTLCIFAALAADTRRQLAYWHDGLTLFSHELAVAQDSYTGHSKLAEALEVSGRMDDALAEFQSYQAQHPNDAAANYNLSAALLRRGRTQEAMQGLQRTLTLTQLPPVLAHTHWQLGNICYQLGDMDAAQQHYRSAVQLNPREYGASMMLGIMLERQGKHEEAIAYLRQSLPMESPDSAYFYLGQAYEGEGRRPEALAAYKEALKFAPGSEELQKAIASVEQETHQP
jgi:Flp pilus assembly protein TadD